MAVAHDASTESHTGTTGSTSEASFSFTHTPAGTPRGVLVFTFNTGGASSAEDVTGVTYGGVSLTAVTGGTAADTATEPGRCTAWFLGRNIPTGAQSVVVTRTNNADTVYAVAVTVTAGNDTWYAGVSLLQENQSVAEVSISDTSNGVNSVRYVGLYYGGNAPNAGANSTALQSIVISASRSSQVARETTAGQGARSVGFSAGTIDDVAQVALAIFEAITRTKTQSANAVVLKTSSKTQSADAIVLKTETATQSADARIQQGVVSVSQDADALVASRNLITQSVDGGINKLNNKHDYRQDAFISSQLGITQAADAMVSVVHTRTQSADARVVVVPHVEQSVSAIVKKTLTRTQGADAVLGGTKFISQVADSVVVVPLTVVQLTDAEVGGPGSRIWPAHSDKIWVASSSRSWRSDLADLPQTEPGQPAQPGPSPQPPPEVDPVSSFPPPDGSDQTAVIQHVIDTAPDGATLYFPKNQTYRAEGGIQVIQRRDLTIYCRGTTFRRTVLQGNVGTPGGKIIYVPQWTFGDNDNIWFEGAKIVSVGTGTFDTNYEGESSLRISGGRDQTFKNITADHPGGDGFAWGWWQPIGFGKPGIPCERTHIIGGASLNAGRQGIAVSSNILNCSVSGMTIDGAARSSLDLELAGQASALLIDGLDFTDNVVTNVHLNFISAAGVGSQRNVRILRNTTNTLKSKIGPTPNNAFPTNRFDLEFSDNVGTDAWPSPGSNIIAFRYIDGVVVNRNTQPGAEHVGFEGCLNVSGADNSWAMP